MRISDWSSDVCSSDLTHCKEIAAVHRFFDRAHHWFVLVDKGAAYQFGHMFRHFVVIQSVVAPQAIEIMCGAVGFGNQKVRAGHAARSEEHTSELQSLMRISYAVFCLKKKTTSHMQELLTHHKLKQ